MNDSIDTTSLLISCSVDQTVAAVEKRLNREGYTLGYRPADGRKLTLRKALEKRIPNKDALLYGEIDDLCVSIQAARNGETIATRNVPRAATGPDFKKILLGSGKRYATIRKAVLKIHPLPGTREKVKLAWTAKKDRDDFLKKFWGSGIRPAVFAAGSRSATVVLEGSKGMVASERKCLHRLVRETKGKTL